MSNNYTAPEKDKETIETAIRAIMIDKLGLNTEIKPLLDTDRVSEDLGADSLDVVELVMEFEKEFDITLPDEYVAEENPKTVADYFKLVAPDFYR